MNLHMEFQLDDEPDEFLRRIHRSDKSQQGLDSVVLRTAKALKKFFDVADLG